VHQKKLCAHLILSVCPFESRLVQIYCTKTDSMLYFFTPYSFDKKLFEAWDDYMNLIKEPSDWVCMMDGDVLFLISDFGHQMQTYIDKYPDAGLFTCYASRTSRPQLKWKGADMTNPSLIYHRTKAEQLYAAYHGQVEELGDLNALGYLMLIRKSTWLLIREQVKEWTADKDILGVDTRISKAIRKANFKSYLMRGMYVLHYYRMKNGEQDKSILL